MIKMLRVEVQMWAYGLWDLRSTTAEVRVR